MLKVQQMTTDEVQALQVAGMLPAGIPGAAIVIGVSCPHFDRPAFQVFVPPPMELLSAVFAQAGEAPEVLTPVQMRREAVKSFTGVVSCSCADRFWMQYGPAYPLKPGVSHDEAEVCIRLVPMDQRVSTEPPHQHS